mgnify:CR=1 FL=1|jgi:hypothetical protein
MVVYTRHARKRMAERRVPESQVVEIVESPDEIAIGDNGEMIAIRYFALHEIRVVYREPDTNTVLIITVIKTGVR